MRSLSLALAAALCAWGAGAGAQAPASPERAASSPAASVAASASALAVSASAPVPSASAPRPSASLPLMPATRLQGPPRGEAARALPIVLQARVLRGQPELETVAEGDVEFRRGGLVIRADRLAYDMPEDLAQAKGHVHIEREGVVYRGPELQLKVQRFEGFFLEPSFELLNLGAGGRADRVDFLGPGRSRAVNASYTSCPREEGIEPDWVIRADRVHLDLEANEGIAEGAVLRFLGAPLIALPTLSFPLSDARKSGWLPPTFNTDNRSGVELSVPYYWNIAPNRDATIAPRVITRRGFGVEAEFRYLEPHHSGELRVDALPDDRLAETARGSVHWQHESGLPYGIRARADLMRVSDEDWWKDFPNRGLSIAPRLLPSRVAFERPFGWTGGGGLAYARVAQWQVLQGTDEAVVSPYERQPQVGLRLGGRQGSWVWALESEYNRFTLPAAELARAGRSGGDRAHALVSIAYGEREPGLWLVPRLSLNAAAYDSEASGRARRTIPTFSVDAGLEFERAETAFGRALRQTLEPRLLYVNTPTRAQRDLPNFDAAAKDFNFASIYSENAFSGIDRVSDAHQLTAGVTTRLVDEATGGEALRLGIVQRYLFRPQQVTAQPDGTPDGEAMTQRFSDVLLLGSTNALPNWTFDATVQYSAEIQRSVRSILGMRYSPGRFRTVGTTYRFARGLSEQIELGWQWPIVERPAVAANASGSGCGGSWYGVGRVNYSLKDSRVTDSVLGLEYDAGCWIARVVAERLSTGRSQATTRLQVQLELVGLSRIGSNPLRVLKDNIPGYQLLREERASPVASPE
ncbi:MAG: LPS-assembly protein LptD [Burkholderiales bacterium]|nr:LPS-assembly protein LptD [Burkholderiales bacterium]